VARDEPGGGRGRRRESDMTERKSLDGRQAPNGTMVRSKTVPSISIMPFRVKPYVIYTAVSAVIR
jgi:hypothetical protein